MHAASEPNLLPERKCSRCGGVFTVAFFTREHSSVCHGCEPSPRTGSNQRNEPREKARRTLYHHANKYVRLGYAKSRDDFIERYRWDFDQMAHDLEHVATNGCPYCHRSFSGLSDISLDVVRSDDPPHYGVNTRWCCRTCNTKKAQTPPDMWGAKLSDWERWLRWNSRDYPPDSLFGDWQTA